MGEATRRMRPHAHCMRPPWRARVRAWGCGCAMRVADAAPDRDNAPQTAFEIVDYVDWSRECYLRRLTVSSPPPYHPPLYPIPGESRDAAGGRQGIFHRLSQRMISGLLHGGGGSSGAHAGDNGSTGPGGSAEIGRAHV